MDELSIGDTIWAGDGVLYPGRIIGFELISCPIVEWGVGEGGERSTIHPSEIREHKHG